MAYLVYFKYENISHEVAVQTDDITKSIVKLSDTLFPQLEQYGICMQDNTIRANKGKIYFKYRMIDKIFSFQFFAQRRVLMKLHFYNAKLQRYDDVDIPPYSNIEDAIMYYTILLYGSNGFYLLIQHDELEYSLNSDITCIVSFQFFAQKY